MKQFKTTIKGLLFLSSLFAFSIAQAGGCEAAFDANYSQFSNKVQFINQSNYAGGSNYVDFSWSFGDGNYSNDYSPTHAYQNEGTYIICLSLIDSLNNCFDTYCDTIEIDFGNSTGTCKSGFEISPNSNGTGVIFVNKSVGTDLHYYWSFGDGTSSTEENPDHNYKAEGTYTVCLKVKQKDANGNIICIDEACDIVHAYSNGNNCIDYSLIDTNKACMTIADPVCGCDGKTYSNACVATYFYGVTSYTNGPCGGGGTACEAGFTAKFDANNQAKVSFIDQSAQGQYTQWTSWYWDFGDGTTSYDQNPVHEFAKEGTYNVCLTFWGYNANGDTCVDDVCKKITIGNPNTPCEAAFDYKTDYNSTLVEFFNQSQSGNIYLDYYWDFGDGMYSKEKNPFHTYAKDGTYKVCLTITSSNDSTCYDKYCEAVTVYGGSTGGKCEADFKFSVGSSTKGFPVSFEDNSANTNGSTSYYWDFGNGSTGWGTSPKNTYDTAGTYKVCLTIYVFDYTTGDTCIDDVCKTVVVGGNGTYDCDAYFTVHPDSVPGVYWFTNHSKGNGLTYHWDFGDGTTSTDQHPNHSYGWPNKPVTYEVCLTIQGPNNCYDRKCKAITVGSTAYCEADFAYNVSNGTTVVFDDNSKGGSSWTWHFGDGNTSNDQNPTHTYSAPGVYSVCLTINDANGNCSNTVCKNIKIAGSTGSDCEADFFTYADSTSNRIYFNNASKGDVTNYIWDFGDGNTSTDKNPTHEYANAGTYLVCLTIFKVTANGAPCNDTRCKIVVVGASNSACQASFISFPGSKNGTGTPYSTGLTYFYDMSDGNPTNWYWDFGDGNTSTEQNPTHQYAKPGDYTVCLTIVTANQTCTSVGCQSTPVYMVISGTVSIEEVKPELDNYPNPFSSFTTIKYNLAKDAKVSIEVYDLLGNRVETIENGTVPAGTYQKQWNAESLTEGLYILRLTANGQSVTRKLLLTR